MALPDLARAEAKAVGASRAAGLAPANGHSSTKAAYLRLRACNQPYQTQFARTTMFQ